LNVWCINEGGSQVFVPWKRYQMLSLLLLLCQLTCLNNRCCHSVLPQDLCHKNVFGMFTVRWWCSIIHLEMSGQLLWGTGNHMCTNRLSVCWTNSDFRKEGSELWMFENELHVSSSSSLCFAAGLILPCFNMLFSRRKFGLFFNLSHKVKVKLSLCLRNFSWISIEILVWCSKISHSNLLQYLFRPTIS
jgi:hypothetical protein